MENEGINIMNAWSLSISLLISGFAFLVYLIALRNIHNFNLKKNIDPALKEAEQLIVKNFLSVGKVPSKSKIISIVCTLANKYNIHLLSHLPIQSIIDNLIYTVMSNELLGAEQKKNITDSLLSLKTEPISSEDYIHLVIESEKKDNLKQKILYNSILTLLLLDSVAITSFYIAITQYYQVFSEETLYFMGMILISCIGFGTLIGGLAIFSMIRDFYLHKTIDPTSQSTLASLNKAPAASNKELAQESLAPMPMLTRTFEDKQYNSTNYTIPNVSSLNSNTEDPLVNLPDILTTTPMENPENSDKQEAKDPFENF